MHYFISDKLSYSDCMNDKIMQMPAVSSAGIPTALVPAIVHHMFEYSLIS